MTKIFFKEPSIIEGSKQIHNLLKSARIAIENMPACSFKTSILLTQEAYEKKINVVARKEAINQAMAIIKKNPDAFIASLPDELKASFARNDINIAPIIDAEKVQHGQKQKKRK
jgi:hypothetical protein